MIRFFRRFIPTKCKDDLYLAAEKQRHAARRLAYELRIYRERLVQVMKEQNAA